ncbi:MAG TPA: NAD-dependent epimerase/dehydratase family protein [bacterium]|nr:NAD-dependent epimerase/dehydratase family protein [bacterium]
MKVLFIGGTGVISSACSELALRRGIALTLLNRGTGIRPVPEGAEILRADIGDAKQVRDALADRTFDAVVDWIVFTPDQAERDLSLFRGRTGQYLFIGSASAYQTPPALLPVTESTPLDNPFWAYSRDKIACEDRLIRAYREEKFPVTIVRPSHTYDRTLLPFTGRYTVVDRMRRGKPVIVHGDGTSLWTLTHHRDFAVGLVGLLGNPHAIGEAFHITSDEILTWNQIYRTVAQAAGVAEPRLAHIDSGTLASHNPDWGANLLGDKSHSMIFDNTKIRRAVPDFHPVIPFHQGAEEIMAWHDADPVRRVVDPELDALYERILSGHGR